MQAVLQNLSNQMDQKAIAAEFGRVVREMRAERGYSQEEFAYVAGIHRTSMGLIERGKSVVNLYTAFKIAEALECDLAVLIQGMKK